MLVVGNGFTLSFLQRRPNLLRTWSSSRPLSFDIPTPGSTGQLLDNLPYFKQAVLEHLRASPNASHFEIIRAVLNHAQELTHAHMATTTEEQWERDNTGFYIDTEARHFFSLAYSHLQLQMEAAFNGPWEWPAWIAEFFSPSDFIYVISFNYDLLIEMLLDRLDFHVIRQQGARKPGVVVFKPHGSIDYEMTGLVVPRTYPLRDYAGWNDSPVEVIPYSNILRGRIQPVAVLPTERTIYTRAQFNQQGYLEALTVARNADRLVIIGFSYSDADRHELDSFLDNLSPSATVYLIDPYPSTALIKSINDRGFKLSVSATPPALNG